MSDKKKTAEKPATTAIATIDEKHLAEQKYLGMKGVNPADIRPPMMLIRQKSSKADTFIDIEGKQVELGEYFNTGKLTKCKTFECYIIKAAEGTFIDKNHREKGEQRKYDAVGMLADDLSLIGMTFKGTALNTLSSLFTIAVTQKRPMYSFLVKFETKFLSGNGNEWFIPVLRVLGPETDAVNLAEIEKQAVLFDARKIDNDEDDEPPLTKTPEPPLPTEPH